MIDHGKIVENIHKEKWRLENLYYIRNKKGKTIPFNMNKTQKILNDSRSPNNMTLKSRQQGVSTYYLLKYLNRAMFRRNYTVGILSHDRKSLEKLFRIIKFAYEKFPVPELKPKLGRGGGSKYEYEFPSINSRIYVDLEVRSEAINALHVSEYGLMKDKQRFNASVDAVPVEGGEISIESTPFGINHFYEDWNDPDFPSVKHFFPWFIHYENAVPRLDKTLTWTGEENKLKARALEKYGIKLTDKQLAWRRFKIKQKGRKSFLEEHPEDDVSCFLLTGDAVLDLEQLSELKEKCQTPTKVFGKYGKIFKNKVPGHTYVIGADTAEGVGSDYSVGVVIDKNTREQVATIRGHIKPKIFAEALVELAGYYKDNTGFMPQLAVERNNHGHAVLLWLEEELQYENLFEHNDKRPGWKTNSVTRPIMMDTFLDAVEEEEITIYDQVIINECMKLVDNNGKIEAMSGHHDDSVIATAIGLQLCLEGTSFLERMMNE